MISVIVISLVVWLVLVFLSVTSGIEKNWLTKLTTLHAPLRISPTEAYYHSYYYQIDSISSQSNYTPKTIAEKASSLSSDPYSAETDIEIPSYWPEKKINTEGRFLDPVKEAVKQLDLLKNKSKFIYQDYEIAGALLKLEVEHEGRTSFLSQMSYLLSLSDQNPHLADLLLPPGDEIPYAARIVEGKILLPAGSDTPILLSKNYKDSKVQIGARGTLSYSAPTAATSQEQRIPVRVAGFYDPGLLSFGNRCLIVPSEVTHAIHASSQTFSPDGTPTNGIFIWPQEDQSIDELKLVIANQLKNAGIDEYWQIASFDEFEFSKDLLNQFRSDRTLFTLIAGIILFVACCNIISLLILLVNDKKKEIAILQSMGASGTSIALIFAVCGVSMGLLSCAAGSALALTTLTHLDFIVALLSSMQGHSAFNPTFFGQHLPNSLSADALRFVLIATPILSLLAGLIPAVQAIRIRPSVVLRSE